jgi:hypothetical protein
MAKTLQIGLAAVLLSAGVALAPAYAAAGKSDGTKDTSASATADLTHTSTPARGLKGKKLVQVDQNERRITAELNRSATSGQTTPASGQQSSLQSSSNTQQAAAEAEPENSIQ